jgi:hypothetical protein
VEGQFVIGRIRNRSWRLLAVGVCQALLLQPVLAQTSQNANMRIIVVQGANARNTLRQISAQPIIVRVEDASSKPVGGATVTFTAPVAGPGGIFENDTQTIRVTTGADGVASAGPYRANGVEGSYMISVRAEFQGLPNGFTSIQQNNSERKGKGKMIAILAAAGGVAAAVAVSRKVGDKQGQAPVITFGSSAVGAPGQ